MKNFFQLFKKKEPASKDAGTASSKTQSTGPSQVQVDMGTNLSGFLPSSNLSLVLVGIFTVALAFLAYRYLSSSISGTSEAASVVVPIAVSGKQPAPELNTAQNILAAHKLFGDKKLDESIEIYNKILQKTPNDVQALNDLGVLYLKKNRLAESEVHLKQSLSVAPDCVVCLNNLGYLKTLQGESRDAEAYLKKAIALDAEYIDAYFNLGVLYEKNGDIGGSANAYREFLRRSKDGDSALNLELKQHLYSILEK